MRELQAAAKAAQALGKRTAALTDKTLTVDHLISRLKDGNPAFYILKRKGWNRALPRSDSLKVSALLDTLACELLEEAALLGIAIEKDRQIGSSRRGTNSLIDALLGKSLNLGARNRQGEPAPDYALVYAVVTSLHPTLSLDIVATRKRWNARQGKLRSKNP